MPSDLLVPASLDNRLKEIYRGISSFPGWESYLSGRNGVLDPLIWLQKNDDRKASEIIAEVVAKWGVPFAPLSQHVCHPVSVMTYLAVLKSRENTLEDVLTNCLPIPLATIGHVVVFAHCDPEAATPVDFPRHLSSPIWTTVDDYLKLRLDFHERTRALWQSFEAQEVDSASFKFDPKDLPGAIRWLMAQPTISPREQNNLEFLLALPPAELSLSKLPPENVCAFNSDSGKGPSILPMGSLLVHLPTAEKMKTRGRWSEFGAIPYFSTSTHLFCAAQDPNLSSFRSEAARDFPGLKLVATHASGDAVRYAITQLSAGSGQGIVQKVSTTEDLSSALFHYDARKYEGKSPRSYAENIPSFVECIVGDATIKRASDIHFDIFGGNTRIRYDIDGESRVMHSLPKDFADKVANWLKENACKRGSETQMPGAPQEGNFVFGYNGKRITCRVGMMFCLMNAKLPKIVVRVQDPSNGIKSLSELGLELSEMRTLRSNIQKKQGLVIVSGATGMGKSTTLMACLQEINDPKRALYSLEDPVEYVIPGVAQIAVASKKEEAMANRPMVIDALRGLLRMAPKTIMVGEIRDHETVSAAVEASNTGHMIFATVHANSTVDVVQRIKKWDVDMTNFGENVRLIVTQRLVKRLCGCYERIPVDESTREVFTRNKIECSPFIGKRKQGGCPRCEGTGYHGRLVIMELLEVNRDLRDLISDGARPKELREGAEKAKFQPMIKAALRRVATEQTSMEAIKELLDSEFD